MPVEKLRILSMMYWNLVYDKGTPFTGSYICEGVLSLAEGLLFTVDTPVYSGESVYNEVYFTVKVGSKILFTVKRILYRSKELLQSRGLCLH